MYQQLLLHADVKKELQRLECTKQIMEQRLTELPKGAIHVRHGKPYHIFRVNGKQKMLSIKDPHLLEELRLRKFIEHSLPYLIKRIKNCELFLEKDVMYNSRKLCLELPERYRGEEYRKFWLPGEVNPKEWAYTEYEHNLMPIEKPNMTAKGRKVRSKSESFIGTEIEGAQLLYQYEPKLVLFGEVFYPDFMILLPNILRVVIWEHFGMMDDPKYAQKAMHKIEAYSKAGWILGKNFFFTYETENIPFSSFGAKTKLAEILEQDKLIW